MSTAIHIPEPARSRIIRITNVHFNATNEEIEGCFAGSVIEDIFRTINVRTGKKTIAYILFSTITEKNRAVGSTGLWIRGREIAVQPAHDGNYELNQDETAFINVKKSRTATAEDKQEDSPSFDASSFPALGMPKVTETSMKTAEPSVVEPKIPETESKTMTKNDPETGNTTDAKLAAGTPTMSPEPTQGSEEAVKAASACNESKTSNSDTSSAIGVPGKDKFSHASSSKQNLYPLYSVDNPAPPPPQDFQNWNLHGHNANDRSKNILTPGDWYNFHSDQFVKLEQQQRGEGTNAGRIVNQKVEDEDA